MANHWNHHRKHGSLETLRHVHINRSGAAKLCKDELNAGRLTSGVVASMTAGKDVKIEISATACHYGGWRFWLVCPGCKGNKLVLRYIESNNLYYCNNCLNGVHRSAQSSKSNRRYNRRANIRERLGLERQHGLRDNVWRWHRPKGMHWKTFNPLMRKHNDLLEADSQLWVKSCQRFFPGVFNDLR